MENTPNAVKPSEILPKNFDGNIHRPRNKDGGGVMVAIRKDIVATEVNLKAGTNGEVVCAKVTLEKSQPLFICAYYRPPGDNVDALDSLELALEEIQTEVNKNPRAGLVIAGDFNAPGIDWETNTVKQDGLNKTMCQRLLDLLGTFELKQLVHKPTRLNSILDLFCTNKPGLVKNVSLVPGISDHDGVVIVDTCLKAVINKKTQRCLYMWSKADWDTLKNEASTFCKDFLSSFETRTVEDNWQVFTKRMNDFLRSIPSKLSSTRYNLPWVSTEIKRMIRKKRRAYNKAKSGNEVHRAKFKKIQNATRDALRKSHWNYLNDMFKEGLDKGIHL